MDTIQFKILITFFNLSDYVDFIFGPNHTITTIAVCYNHVDLVFLAPALE